MPILTEMVLKVRSYQSKCSNQGFSGASDIPLKDVKMTGVRVITPVNHSCKLNFASDFHSCHPYFRSEVTPVEANFHSC